MRNETPIAIVDTGGNLASVRLALERLGVAAEVTLDPARIARAPKVIVPGVGAAAAAMQRLDDAGVSDVLRGLTQPVLGICLGMQLLFSESDEGACAAGARGEAPEGSRGEAPGPSEGQNPRAVPLLGIIPGRVTILKIGATQRLPHMGWNVLEPVAGDPLFSGLAPGAHTYFVHSFRAPDSPWTSCYATYGERFPAAVRRDNFTGTQFHPERSGPDGARILRNFVTP